PAEAVGTGFPGAALASVTATLLVEFSTALMPRSSGEPCNASPPGPSPPPLRSGSPLPSSLPCGEVANIPRRLFTCKTSGGAAGEGFRFKATSAPDAWLLVTVAALSGGGAIGCGAAGRVACELSAGTGNLGAAFTGVT